MNTSFRSVRRWARTLQRMRKASPSKVRSAITPTSRRTAAPRPSFFRNYKQEFARLDLDILYLKDAGQRGWFGPTFIKIARESDIGDILNYNQDEERMVVGKSKDAQPTYYVAFVTAFRDGNMPDRLRKGVTKGRALAQIVVVSVDTMEQKMAFVNADAMKQALHDSGAGSALWALLRQRQRCGQGRIRTYPG